jgi:hypothetical protein
LPHGARYRSAREVSTTWSWSREKRWQGDATTPYHRRTETNRVQRSEDLTVISQEIFDPTPSTYPVDRCESWGFRWED